MKLRAVVLAVTLSVFANTRFESASAAVTAQHEVEQRVKAKPAERIERERTATRTQQRVTKPAAPEPRAMP
jgi:hypothetical protein